MGTDLEYQRIFRQIILELQRCQENYEEMLTLLLKNLLILFSRKFSREQVSKNGFLDKEMDDAVIYFNENYNHDINIEK